MTKQEFDEKVEMLTGRIVEMIRKGADKIYKSNAVDFNQYDDNFILPCIFMSAMGLKINEHYLPRWLEEKKEVKNISLFL